MSIRGWTYPGRRLRPRRRARWTHCSREGYHEEAPCRRLHLGGSYFAIFSLARAGRENHDRASMKTARNLIRSPGSLLDERRRRFDLQLGHLIDHGVYLENLAATLADKGALHLLRILLPGLDLLGLVNRSMIILEPSRPSYFS